MLITNTSSNTITERKNYISQVQESTQPEQDVVITLKVG